ncbi:Cysteine desulfurase =_ SufS [hydrothermal vent metagenome]|uniref:cysteine desulfurase n=1 Tax=hydrothermal vent metagenome TaxID=652676 RepID=A0A3B1D3T7_9ZZZZ
MQNTTLNFNVTEIRQNFPNLHIKVQGKPLIYLDNAATTLKPQCVIDAIDQHYSQETSNVHRGVHYLSEQATAKYEKSREKVKNFINASDSSEIIFTRGTTESINMVALSYGRAFLNKEDEIIISEMEHHSNIVPWQMLCEERGCILRVIPMNDDGDIIFEEFEKLLSSKTKLVSIVYTSNSLGTVNPVKKIIDSAHKHNALVLLDGAQTVSHRQVDVQALNCDFFVFSGHKLFGPTGVGVLYGKKELLDKMPPIYGGGDMIASVTFEKTTYNHLPYKFEAGTPNIAGVIGLGAAIDYINTLDWNALGEYEAELLNYGTQILKNISDLKLIGTAKHKAPVLSFFLPDVHPHDLGTLVNDDGVAIRTGHHCTQPVMKHFNIPATARASLSIYNTKKEIDILAESILRAKDIFK